MELLGDEGPDRRPIKGRQPRRMPADYSRCASTGFLRAGLSQTELQILAEYLHPI
jgi:hypothetical protein